MGFHAQISCRNCHTTRTPLWRAGPDGPRSLCNTCGLRYRKRRRALLGLDKGGAEKCMKRNRTNKILTDLDRSLGRRSNLKEEEEAAMLLMALSDASLCIY